MFGLSEGMFEKLINTSIIGIGDFEQRLTSSVEIQTTEMVIKEYCPAKPKQRNSKKVNFTGERFL